MGIMLLRKQDPQANFEAMLAATEPFENSADCASIGFSMRCGSSAPIWPSRWSNGRKRCHSPRIVAFGIGGDELSIPTQGVSEAFISSAAHCGLHRLIHAGEIGGPEKIREAIELLGVERIGHGIAAIHDPALMDLLAERRIPLEVCPVSNIWTGALARQLGQDPPTSLSTRCRGCCATEFPWSSLRTIPRCFTLR